MSENTSTRIHMTHQYYTNACPVKDNILVERNISQKQNPVGMIYYGAFYHPSKKYYVPTARQILTVTVLSTNI